MSAVVELPWLPPKRPTRDTHESSEALAFADRLASSAVVYGCMDELTAFQGAASDLGTY
jgi:hypothetical protein